MTKQKRMPKQKQEPKFKVGDLWKPYPIEHWSLQSEGQTEDFCKDKKFKQGLTLEMVGMIKNQEPIKITTIRDDFIVAADNGGFSWDMHSLGEKLSIEEYPEYYL